MKAKRQSGNVKGMNEKRNEIINIRAGVISSQTLYPGNPARLHLEIIFSGMNISMSKKIKEVNHE